MLLLIHLFLLLGHVQGLTRTDGEKENPCAITLLYTPGSKSTDNWTILSQAPLSFPCARSGLNFRSFKKAGPVASFWTPELVVHTPQSCACNRTLLRQNAVALRCAEFVKPPESPTLKVGDVVVAEIAVRIMINGNLILFFGVQ